MIVSEFIAQSVNTDRLEDVLRNWARWMRTGGLSCLDHPSSSSGIGYSHGLTFDDLMDDAQRNEAIIADGSMRDLSSIEREALHWAYLEASWVREYPNPHAALVVAKEAVRLSMKRRGWGELLTT